MEKFLVPSPLKSCNKPQFPIQMPALLLVAFVVGLMTRDDGNCVFPLEMVGVYSVGLVDKTTLPDPVEVLTPVPPLATGNTLLELLIIYIQLLPL